MVFDDLQFSLTISLWSSVYFDVLKKDIHFRVMIFDDLKAWGLMRVQGKRNWNKSQD